MSPRAVVQPVSESVVAYVQPPGGWYESNAGWVRGETAALLVDTCATEALTARYLAAAGADLGDRPLTLALTHGHGDHVNGAAAVADLGATVFARQAASQIVLSGPHTFPQIFECDSWGDIDPPEKIEDVETVTLIDVGGRTPEIHPVPGVAHTRGDLVVWEPEDRVLFTGDLVFVGVCPLSVHGSVRGWLEVLTSWLPQFDAAVVVPGHGPAQTSVNEATVPLVEYFRWLIEVTAETPDYAALDAEARTRWPDWLDPERHAVNLRVAHAEAQGVPPDPAESMAALVAAAGGPITLNLDPA